MYVKKDSLNTIQEALLNPGDLQARADALGVLNELLEANKSHLEKTRRAMAIYRQSDPGYGHTYERKTYDAYYIYSNYGYGWTFECNAEDISDAKRLLREYNDNDPGTPHKIVKRREKLNLNTI